MGLWGTLSRPKGFFLTPTPHLPSQCQVWAILKLRPTKHQRLRFSDLGTLITRGSRFLSPWHPGGTSGSIPECSFGVIREAKLLRVPKLPDLCPSWSGISKLVPGSARWRKNPIKGCPSWKWKVLNNRLAREGGENYSRCERPGSSVIVWLYINISASWGSISGLFFCFFFFFFRSSSIFIQWGGSRQGEILLDGFLLLAEWCC